MSPEKDAVAAVWSHKRFWLLQMLAIGAWIALALAWFWLPDSRAWGVALSAALGVAVVAGGLWLVGAALLFYQTPGPIWRDSLRRVPALLVWGAVFALGIWVSMRLKPSGWIWIVPAVLLLPLAAQVAAEGVRGMFGMVWSLRYFPAAALLLAAGAYLPYVLINWRPQVAGLAVQTASLAVRFGLAYLVAVSAWLILASLVARLSRGPAPVRSDCWPVVK